MTEERLKSQAKSCL